MNAFNIVIPIVAPSSRALSPQISRVPLQLKAGEQWQGWSIRVVDEAMRDVFSVPVRLK